MTKARWMIHLPKHKPFAMVGDKVSHGEALRRARLIWPDAVVK